ncbi:OsmC family protein [Cordyceps fumosorosea ARSEF 2679]|uniref:OsmC family protein n=1 Tax=Cordyceps fumosorosea (strain ARSEF 2679) TaxID=1081104 RepID=A0A167R2L5_CORFA|nr:OsmC family protein [Cordyceps fumosorosea ARSEF 2679]OAA58217.1 OsmC family protein [Cordyceps fumosorosea ARSEF 2679]
MNTLRQYYRPLARHATRALPAQRRLLASDAPTLYTATATTQGPRGGNINGSEGFQAAYVMPKALGGPGGERKTNPEELLAAGYSNCFQVAMNLAAISLKRRLPGGCQVKAAVELLGSIKEMDMGFRVGLEVRAKGMGKGELEEVVEKAREICPYYRAMHGQVETNIKVLSD